VKKIFLFLITGLVFSSFALAMEPSKARSEARVEVTLREERNRQNITFINCPEAFQRALQFIEKTYPILKIEMKKIEIIDEGPFVGSSRH